MGEFIVDHTESTKKYASMQSVCGNLCRIFTAGAVFVRNEFDRRGTAVNRRRMNLATKILFSNFETFHCTHR